MGISEWCILGLLVVLVRNEDDPTNWEAGNSSEVDKADPDGLADTDLIHASVIFRHGDRTPVLKELATYPFYNQDNKFFPHGIQALTNEGKQRGYSVGEYLRNRYDGFISRLYLPEETVMRTTAYARTQMTALTVLAGLFPPNEVQKWNPKLDWQPVPYHSLPYDDDDLLYRHNCPRYLRLKDHTYSLPKVQSWIKPYNKLFEHLSQKTGANITTTENVLYLDNLFQALANAKLGTPEWAEEVMHKIKKMTKMEYAIEFYNTELIRLSTGVLLSEIVNAMMKAISGKSNQPKLRIYSAHENNVAALMAATRVFQPHQPAYGATFSLELRRNKTTQKFGIAAVYSPTAGGPAQVLKIKGCYRKILCDCDTFRQLTELYMWTKEDYREQCY